MYVPFFRAETDPGPDFAELAKRAGLLPEPPTQRIDERLTVTHATTCVAIRFDGGVVMAGDRRATAGHLISHRTIEKVFPADRHSGVAIAGAAGPAVEMVRLFQLQLEHYEKVEGEPLSLEGKANQLSQMVRNHLPAAMQGLAVVPLFAGFDRNRDIGRLFQYDVTGGRYEELNYSATGSGSLHAATVIKVNWRSDLDEDRTIDLALTSLYEAADEDSATGGADLLRGIYPVVASITADGFRRIDDDELGERTASLVGNLGASHSRPASDQRRNESQESAE